MNRLTFMTHFLAGRKIRVFIADDSATVRERLITMLEDIGTVEIVGQAQNVDDAITSIRETQPEVVILDIRMPGGSGLDVLRNIKADKPAPKVIMLTNYPFFQYRKKCLEAGANFFFDKSTEFDLIPQAFDQLAANAASTSTAGSGAAAG